MVVLVIVGARYISILRQQAITPYVLYIHALAPPMLFICSNQKKERGVGQKLNVF